jgi:hypothetical protein
MFCCYYTFEGQIYIYACCGNLCFYGSSTMTKTGNAAHSWLVSTRRMYTWSSLTCALSVSNKNLGYVAFVQTLLKFMATHAAYSWGFCFLMHEPQTTCFKKCKVHHLHKQSQFLSLEESLTFSGACWILITHEVPASWGTSPGWFRKATSLPASRMYSTFSLHNQSQVYEPRRTSNVFECHAALFLDFLRFLRVGSLYKKNASISGEFNFSFGSKPIWLAHHS